MVLVLVDWYRWRDSDCGCDEVVDFLCILLLIPLLCMCEVCVFFKGNLTGVRCDGSGVCVGMTSMYTPSLSLSLSLLLLIIIIYDT